MFTKTWIRDTAERVVRTFAATLAAFFVGDVTVLNVDYTRALGLSGTAALVTLLLAVAAGAGPKDTISPASFVAPAGDGTP